VIRTPAVAALFYPGEGGRLGATVDELLAVAGKRALSGLRALVAPHAGYEYSGPVAATAYAHLSRPGVVVLLGPSHFVPLDGFAVTAADAWATPLGELRVAHDLRDAAVDAGAIVDDRPHEREHALEVQLPFLQRACPEWPEILPIAVGRASPGDVASLIDALGSFVVVSTDLSHYHDAGTAARLDRETADAVVARKPTEISSAAACGAFALRGLVEHARQNDLDVELLDLRTSADTAGDAGRVVGYGAFAVFRS
jgi:AmmeMemoRadiSam system protein B